MKALVYENYARDDDFESILELRDIPEPIPKPNEVIFRVKAAALNYDDIWGMRGKPLAVPLPHISGTDAAGEVTAIGNSVKNIKVGDRVVSHGNMSCRVCAVCTDGREYDCKQRKIWGFETGPLWGGYCEIVHLPEINVVKIPDNVSYEEAAAASMTLLTSWHMLIGRPRLNQVKLFSSWVVVLVLEYLEFRLQNCIDAQLLQHPVLINWKNSKNLAQITLWITGKKTGTKKSEE